MVFFLSDALSQPGARGFEDERQISDRIRDSKNYRHDGSEPSRAKALLIFQTQRQQTWLVATPKRLYCILDDLDRDSPKVQRSDPLHNFVDPDGRIKVSIRTREYSANSGLLDIGDEHTEWLFSKKLFTLRSVEKDVESLLQSAVLTQAV